MVDETGGETGSGALRNGNTSSARTSGLGLSGVNFGPYGRIEVRYRYQNVDPTTIFEDFHFIGGELWQFAAPRGDRTSWVRFEPSATNASDQWLLDGGSSGRTVGDARIDSVVLHDARVCE